MKVKVLRCMSTSPSCWYKDRVGEYFEVDVHDHHSKYLVKGTNKTIDLIDVLPESQIDKMRNISEPS